METLMTSWLDTCLIFLIYGAVLISTLAVLLTGVFKLCLILAVYISKQIYITAKEIEEAKANANLNKQANPREKN